MASARQKRKYSRKEVVDMILNDSDSEGPHCDFDSEMSDSSSESNFSEHTLSIQSSRPQTPSVNSSLDSDESDAEVSLPVRGRNQVRGGRGRARNGRGRAPVRRGRGRGININVRHEQPVPKARQQAQQAGGVPDDIDLALTWKDYDWMDPFVQEWLPDFTAPREILVDTTDFAPVDYFKLFFPSEAFSLVCNETNRYALQFLDSPTDFGRYSRFQNWKDTSVRELQAYIALQMCMGLCQKHEIEDYWGTVHMTRLPSSEVMCRNQYELLTSFLHFANNAEERPTYREPGYDHLWKVRPLMNVCEPTYLNTYGPSRDLLIDESIIRFKGRVSFKQYMPAKPYKWGIKQFVLCESKTGYALKFLTYCGKWTVQARDGFSITENICLDLLGGFENKGHKVYTDNYYTSPNLFQEL